VTFLLDDPGHVAHDDAHGWFEAAGHAAWATCPITENGVLRIIGNPKYPNSPGSPAVVAQIITKLRALPGHNFWPDDVSLVGSGDIDAAKVLTSAQVTDIYLLALAKAHGGHLASFDRKLSTAAVRGGRSALHLIPAR
jgi:toxin-antitoxin system PIN domain toxin